MYLCLETLASVYLCPHHRRQGKKNHTLITLSQQIPKQYIRDIFLLSRKILVFTIIWTRTYFHFSHITASWNSSPSPARCLPSSSSWDSQMDRHRRKQARTKQQSSYSDEVSSTEWEFISMTEQEEDLIHRMYKLVGPRWPLIAGRIPGRKPEEIERFWIMRHSEVFANRRRELKHRRYQHKCSSSWNNNNSYK